MSTSGIFSCPLREDSLLKKNPKLIKIHSCIAGMREHTPCGTGDFSEKGFLLQLQRLLDKVCCSANDVHLALEDISESRSGAFQNRSLGKMETKLLCRTGRLGHILA